MDMETIQQASALHEYTQDIEQKIEFVEGQIAELEQFTKSLSALIKTNESSTLSSLGKGVYVKTKLEDKKLFVDVGQNILVRKTPEQAQEIIEGQIIRLKELRVQLASQLEEYNIQLKKIIEQIENSRKE